MSWHARSLPAAALCAVLTVAAVGCGDDDGANEGADPGAAPTAVGIRLTDAGCSPTTVSGARDGGTVSFAVTNETDDRGEFEILSPAPEILAEEFLDAGASATYDIALAAGTYEIICGLPSDTRAQLTVTGAPGEIAAPSTTIVDAAALRAATAQYQAYVREQVGLLQSGTTAFTDAIREGDLDRAKQLYAPVRVPWELIEPVAELFPDSDAAIDSRSDDFPLGEADAGFTGFHALEYGLWAQGTIDGAEVDLPVLADRLDADIATLVGKVNALTIQPQVMTNGAAALIEEAAQTKITGEEERYSHTDLVTFDANVRGSQQVFELIEPLLETVDHDLTAEITSAFATVIATLDPYRTADGFATYDQVTETDRNRFKTTMAALSEALARGAGVSTPGWWSPRWSTNRPPAPSAVGSLVSPDPVVVAEEQPAPSTAPPASAAPEVSRRRRESAAAGSWTTSATTSPACSPRRPATRSSPRSTPRRCRSTSCAPC